MQQQIYFIACAERIKIGFSRNLERRLKNLSTASAHPFDLIASINGSIKLERAIHRYLAPHNAQAEWFYDCKQVRTVIADLCRLGGGAIGFQETPVQDHPRKVRSMAAERGRYPEYSSALRKLAEPLEFGDRIKTAIDRAAKRSGLSYWRAFDIWYGKARRIEVHEVNMIMVAESFPGSETVRAEI